MGMIAGLTGGTKEQNAGLNDVDSILFDGRFYSILLEGCARLDPLLASWSAISLPSMPQWLGIQVREILNWLDRSK